MILRLRIGRWRFTASVAPVTDVVGVHSNLEDNQHILMWDFDGVSLGKVITALEGVQAIYELPRVYILNTGKPKHYIAYCFKRVSWHKCVEIIATTPYVDWEFFKYGVYREKFTLRVTPKAGRRPKMAWILKSEKEEDAWITDLKRWVKYETVDVDYAHKFKCPGCEHPLRHCITIGE